MTNAISSGMSSRYRVDENGVGFCDGAAADERVESEAEPQSEPERDCRVRIIRAATECAAGSAAVVLSAPAGGAGIVLAAIAGVKCGLEIEAAISCIQGR